MVRVALAPPVASTVPKTGQRKGPTSKRRRVAGTPSGRAKVTVFGAVAVAAFASETVTVVRDDRMLPSNQSEEGDVTRVNQQVAGTRDGRIDAATGDAAQGQIAPAAFPSERSSQALRSRGDLVVRAGNADEALDIGPAALPRSKRENLPRV